VTKDPKGHQASSPWQMPAPAWKDIASRTWQRTWDDNVGLVAAGVAFYGFFALLSLLGMIVLFYGLVAEPRTVVENMRVLTDFSGEQYWTIIAEMEVESVDKFMSMEGMDPAAMKEMETIMKDYQDLVDRGRREIFKVEV
jgi:hypothetical protein